MLKVCLIYTPVFEDYLKKSKVTKEILEENIIRILNGIHHKGEECLPKKDLGRDLILFKGRAQKGSVDARFIMVLYISKNKVMPAFIALKTNRKGKNIMSKDQFYYDATKKCLISDPKVCTTKEIELTVNKVDFGFGWTMPRSR